MRPIGLVYAFVALAGLQSVAHLTPAATEFRVIEVPGSSETIASAINAQGDVVGRYTGNDKRVHGFLLSGSRYTSIDVPHAEFTMVRGINDAGDLVGRATIKGQWVAFVMKKGDIRGITLLSYPGAWRTQGFQINSKGDVVGSWQPEGGGSRGFLYAGDKWISLEHPNATTSYATGINDAGEVVGTWDSRMVGNTDTPGETALSPASMCQAQVAHCRMPSTLEATSLVAASWQTVVYWGSTRRDRTTEQSLIQVLTAPSSGVSMSTAMLSGRSSVREEPSGSY